MPSRFLIHLFWVSVFMFVASQPSIAKADGVTITASPFFQGTIDAPPQPLEVVFKVTNNQGFDISLSLSTVLTPLPVGEGKPADEEDNISSPTVKGSCTTLPKSTLKTKSDCNVIVDFFSSDPTMKDKNDFGLNAVVESVTWTGGGTKATIAAAGEVKVLDSVPESSTFILLGSGLAGVLGLGRKRLFAH